MITFANSLTLSDQWCVVACGIAYVFVKHYTEYNKYKNNKRNNNAIKMQCCNAVLHAYYCILY